LYEIGYGSERTNEETGNKEPVSWEEAQELLDKRISLIVEEAGATEPLLFLTNTRRINKMRNKERVRAEKPVKEYIPNFREEIAKEKEYKGTRKAEKPFHFYNLLAYIMAQYPTAIHEDGLEADDFMCIMQYRDWQSGNTIICSRDKDVRQCPGHHFSWELGVQPAIGPLFVEPLGFLELQEKEDKNGKKKPPKLFGVGEKFFYAQMIMGDVVDNIGGLKGKGPAFAYNLLKDAKSSRECYELVAEKYVQAWEDNWKEKMREQANLLWMVRELDEDNKPVLWKPPKRNIV
jgi:5'-3' exonuclease